MGDYFQEFEDLVGKKVSDHILKEVSVGNFSKKEAEDFAGYLHPEVRGAFVNAQDQANSEYGRRSMQVILSNQYEKVADDLEKKEEKKQEAIDQLVIALEKAGKHVIPYYPKEMSNNHCGKC